MNLIFNLVSILPLISSSSPEPTTNSHTCPPVKRLRVPSPTKDQLPQLFIPPDESIPDETLSVTLTPPEVIRLSEFVDDGRIRIDDATSLGSGAFGHCVSATNVRSGKQIVLKIIPFKFRRPIRGDARFAQFESTVQNEVLAFEHLLKSEVLLGVPSCAEIIVYEGWFHAGTTAYIMLEPMALSLLEVRDIIDHEWNVDDLREIASSILKALDFVNKVHIIHTDVTPANILLSQPLGESLGTRPGPICKLIDFGNSVIVPEADPTINYHPITSMCYRSPEGLKRVPYSYPTDIFSLGITLMEIKFKRGVFPFSADDRAEAATNMNKLKWLTARPEDHESIPPIDDSSREEMLSFRRDLNGSADGFGNMIDKMIEPEAEARWSASDLLKHRFISAASRTAETD